METTSQTPSNGDLNFKIKFNDEPYNEQPLKVVDRGDLTYKEFCGILENVYGLSHSGVFGMTYIDEDHDEVSVGSDEEFKQLLKSAYKWRQKNQFCLLNITTQMDSSEEFENVEPVPSVAGSEMTDIGSVQLEVLSKVNDMTKKLEPLLNTQSEPPTWFKKYMSQFKGEILQEVQGLMRKQQDLQEKPSRTKPRHHTNLNNHAQGGSSGGGGDTHRRIEKLSRKERRLQAKMSRKTDLAKLVKLNSRLRVVNQEKNALISGLSEEERAMWKLSVQQGGGGSNQSGGSKESWGSKECGGSKGSGGSKESGAVARGPGSAAYDAKEIAGGGNWIKVKPGATFDYTWAIINCGQLPWTEETTLNLMSQSQGLEPAASRVTCPRLRSGDAGQISLQFRAPRSPGMFSSVWHFAQRGTQFGQCLSCVVAVDTTETAGPAALQAKSLEYISSEDDESSCDDHSEDFVVIPASFQDQHQSLSACSDGSIEILNHTPSENRTPQNSSPRKSWDFCQVGPGVYRTQEGEILYPPNLAPSSGTTLYPDLTQERDHLTTGRETMYPAPTQERDHLTTGRETMYPAPTQERDHWTTGQETIFPDLTQENLSEVRETIYPNISEAPYSNLREEKVVNPVRIGQDVLVVDEQGQCTLPSSKGDAHNISAAQTPTNRSAYNSNGSVYNSRMFEKVTSQAHAEDMDAAVKAATSAAMLAAQSAAQSAAISAAMSAAGVTVNQPCVLTSHTHATDNGDHSYAFRCGNAQATSGNGTHAYSTHATINGRNSTHASSHTHSHSSSYSSSDGSNSTNATNNGNNSTHATNKGNNSANATNNSRNSAHAANNVNNSTHATNNSTHATNNGTHATNNGTHATNNGNNSTHATNNGSHTGSSTGMAGMNVNDIVNLCTAQAASTAQNLIASFLAHPSGGIANQVLDGFMNMSGPGGGANVASDLTNLTNQVLGGFVNMSGGTSEANTQTSSHAQTNTQTNSHAQTNTQTNSHAQTNTHAGTNSQTSTQAGKNSQTHAQAGTNSQTSTQAGTNSLTHAQTNTQTQAGTNSQTHAQTQAETNAQTNIRSRAHTNRETHTGANTQTNAGEPGAFVFSAQQSVTEILQHLLAAANGTTGEPSNATRPTAEQNNSRVYTRVPQARTPHSAAGNIYTKYPQAREVHAHASSYSDAAGTRRGEQWKPKHSKAHVGRDQGKLHASKDQGKSHATRDQRNNRGMDLSSMLSVLMSSDNSDSGHLSNNSKAKKKAVRKSIKLDRSYPRNKVHLRKKEPSDASASSSRLDPSVWLDLTRRIQDLNTSTTPTSAPPPEAAPAPSNIWSLRPNPPSPPTTPLSAETFLNPVSFSNFPAVPSDPKTSKTPTGNVASSYLVSGFADRGNAANGNVASSSVLSGFANRGNVAIMKLAESGNAASGNVSSRKVAGENASSGNILRLRDNPALGYCASTRTIRIDRRGSKSRVTEETGAESGPAVPNKSGGPAVPNKSGAAVPNRSGAGAAVPNNKSGAGAAVPNKSGAGAAVPNKSGAGAAVPNRSDMMNQLLEMGYMDQEVNRRTLEECEFNVDAAIHKLAALYNPMHNAGAGASAGVGATASAPTGSRNKAPPRAAPRPTAGGGGGAPQSHFERDIDGMMSHMMDMGFENMEENMRALLDSDFQLSDAVLALVAAREKEEEAVAAPRPPAPACNGH